MESFKDRLISILRWSERYTKTDMVYLASGGMWLGVAQLSASIAGFVLTVVLANILTQETLGEYRFLLSAMLILSVISLPGMRPALLESTPKGFNGNILIAYKSIRNFGVISTFLAFGLAVCFFYLGNISLAIGFSLMAIALPWLDASAIYIEHLKARRKFQEVALYTLIGRFVFILISITAALSFPAYSWMIFLAYLVGTIVPNQIFHKKVVHEQVDNTDKTDPNLFSYAGHLSITTALAILSLQLDKILIWYFLGPEALAIFFIAYAIPQEMARFLSIIPILAFPRFSLGNAEKIKETLSSKVFLFALTAAIISTLYILCAPFIFRILFPSYGMAISYSQVLSLSIIATAFTTITTYLTTQKRVGALYLASIVLPVIRIATCLILIPIIGLWGAVYALCIEAVASAALLTFLLKRKSSGPKVEQQ